MDDRDIAGEQVGKLRQEERRAKLCLQLLDQEFLTVVALQRLVDDQLSTAMSRSPPPAGDDQVHGPAGVRIVLHAGIVVSARPAAKTPRRCQFSIWRWSPRLAICCDQSISGSLCTT